MPGAWPRPAAAELAGLATALATVPDGALVLVDGLVGSAAPDVLVPAAGRLRLVLLVHLPLETRGEAAVLAAGRAVITTSPWTGGACRCRRGHVAPPGVDPAPLARRSAGRRPAALRRRGRGAQGPGPAHRRARHRAGPFICTFVGSLTRDPASWPRLRPGSTAGSGWPARSPAPTWPPRTPGPTCWSRLARGDVRDGGDRGAGPRHPGRSPSTSAASRRRSGTPRTAACRGCWCRRATLAAAIRRWLTDAGLRERLRRSARARRATLAGWDVTARTVSGVLAAA